jgi:putative addiction module CopG family antidote
MEAIMWGRHVAGAEMDVHLTGKAERFVRSQIDRGRFRTEDEVLTAALRLLEERERASDAPAIPPDEAEFERRLVAEGLLSRVPSPQDPARSRSFEPIRIEGEPLSETVIRERR